MPKSLADLHYRVLFLKEHKDVNTSDYCVIFENSTCLHLKSKENIDSSACIFTFFFFLK